MLRHEVVQSIRQALGQRGFRADDFSLEQANSNDKKFVVVTITYRFDTQYKIVAHLSAGADFSSRSDKGGRIIVDASPGTLLRSERLSYDSPSELHSAIEAWVSRLERELKAIPMNRAVAEHQAEIDRLAQQVDQLPDEYFTRAESEELRSRLDDLEARMAASIREHAANKREAEDKIADLHRDMDVLKERIDALNKQGWAKTFLIRAAGWMKDPSNRELLQSGTDLAKSLLLPSGPPR